ncbi:hypothetical protein Q9966_011338 [Columba livia]|nr:hypothetical protein Q9966_011338 [Columba livia]
MLKSRVTSSLTVARAECAPWGLGWPTGDSCLGRSGGRFCQLFWSLLCSIQRQSVSLEPCADVRAHGQPLLPARCDICHSHRQDGLWQTQ